MRRKVETVLTTICFVIAAIGMIAAITGGIAQTIYQLVEYGAYNKFLLINHWGTWLMLGGIGLIVIAALSYLAILEWM